MSRINADVLGIGISLTCAIHCIVLPLLISVLPAMGIQFFNHDTIEYITTAAAAVAGTYSLSYGYRNHRNRVPAVIFIAGFLLLLTRQFFSSPDNLSFLMLIPALVLIIAAHGYNYRLCRRPATDRTGADKIPAPRISVLKRVSDSGVPQ